jgi:hypothetical protein
MATPPSKNHPHSFFPFWGKAIEAGWKESREKFGLVVDITLALTAIGLLWCAWYSKHHSNFNADQEDAFMSYWFALVPVGLWLLWFAWHVLKAPHEIYMELYDKYQNEIAEKEQKFTALEAEIESLKSVNKRRFLAFMAQLMAEIENVKPENWTDFWRNKIPSIKHEVALIEDNFKPKDGHSFQFWVNNFCDIVVGGDSSYIGFVRIRIEFLCDMVKNPPNFP